MQTKQSALRPTAVRRPPPFVVATDPMFDPFATPVADRLDRSQNRVTSRRLVHLASAGLLGIAAVVGAPWWGFGLVALAWGLAVRAA